MSEAEPPTETTDPVCGEVFPPELAVFTSKRGDRTVWFCSVTCKQEFDADPARYELDQEPSP